MRRHAVLLLTTAMAMALALATAAVPAGAQAWPDKDRPIRLVVGTPAGGPVDLLARVLGERVGRTLGQPVVVDNRAGGSGAVAGAYLKQQPADGHTLMLAPNAAFTLVPLIRRMPYQPIDDFAFVGQLASTPNVFVVPASSPARSLGEFVALAKARPGAMNYGTMLGIPQHLDFERLKHEAGLSIELVAFTGGAPIVSALMADQVQATLMSVPLVAEWVKGGRLRALAVPGPKRVAALPEVPTMAEAGFGHLRLDAGQSFSLVAPAGTPAAITVKVQQAFAEAAAEPDTRRRLEAAGFELSLRDGAALKGLLQRELAATEAMVKTLNFKLGE